MAGDAAGRRLFFALWPDAPVAAALYRVAAESREACGGRPMRPETLHLTLAYLGRVADRCLPSVLAAGAAAAGDAPTVTCDCLGFWPHNRIVWAGSRTPAAKLQAFAETLRERLRLAGFALDARPFFPHVTLLRDARQDPPGDELSIAWTADELLLVESLSSAGVGPHYRPLARWRLKAAVPRPDGIE